METYIVRVWLPDRPGALGEVATCIGALGAEIVGIDILERGAGRAIDELAVQLPDHSLVGPLSKAVHAIDGVDVEEIRVLDGGVHDPRSDALDVAARIVGATSRASMLDALAVHGRQVLGGTWLAVVHLDAAEVVASSGPAPAEAWLVAFVEGSRSSASVVAGGAAPDDVVWAPLPAARVAIVVGRDGSGFRARERRQVSALARIADARLMDFARRSHPSGRR